MPASNKHRSVINTGWTILWKKWTPGCLIEEVYDIHNRRVCVCVCVCVCVFIHLHLSKHLPFPYVSFPNKWCSLISTGKRTQDSKILMYLVWSLICTLFFNLIFIIIILQTAVEYLTIFDCCYLMPLRRIKYINLLLQLAISQDTLSKWIWSKSESPAAWMKPYEGKA